MVERVGRGRPTLLGCGRPKNSGRAADAWEAYKQARETTSGA